MAFLLRARKALLVAIALALAGCAKEDGSRILGKWQAERLQVMSLRLPLGPELEITRNALVMGDGVSMPIAGITQDGDEVTLETDALVGVSFYFVDADRMFVELPVVGEVYYRRVGGQAGAMAAPQTEERATAISVPAASPAPTTVHPVREVHEPKAVNDPASDYQQALALMRQGDHDGALRSLHAAFRDGFRDTALLERSPEFDALKADVRYQALVARYAGD